MNILIIDDDAVCRCVAAIAVTEMGADAIEIEDGKSALAWLGENKCDCILMDYLLPDMDGVELITAIRASGDNTPVVLLSGTHDPVVIAAAMEAGAGAFLLKGMVSENHLDEICNAIKGVAKLSG